MTISISNTPGVFRDRAQFACALAALDRRDFATAETELTALLEGPLDEADRGFTLNKRGVARIALGRRDDAQGDFTAALEARAHYAPALVNLGNLLLEGGSMLDAIALYERAVAADPEYAVGHFNLGVAYKKAGRIAEGVRELRRAQQLEDRSRASALRSSRRFRLR